MTTYYSNKDGDYCCDGTERRRHDKLFSRTKGFVPSFLLDSYYLFIDDSFHSCGIDIFFFFPPPPGGRMMMQIMSLMVLSRDRIFCIGPIIARGHHFPKSASSNFMPIGVPIVNISRIIISNLRNKPNKYWNNICPHNYSPRRNSGMEFMP